jgi:hypothetical protein
VLSQLQPIARAAFAPEPMGAAFAVIFAGLVATIRPKLAEVRHRREANWRMPPIIDLNRKGAFA